MPSPNGKKLVEMVKDPSEWYEEGQFRQYGVDNKIFLDMEQDGHHLMKVNQKSLSFFGGYILGYSIREAMGVRDLIEELPHEQKYVEPLRFAQLMEIPPDMLPDQISPPGLKSQNLVEKVQHNDRLVFRISVRSLAYLSLPAVKAQSMEELDLRDLIYKCRVTGEQIYLGEFLKKIKKDVERIASVSFREQGSIFGRDLIIAVGLEGAEEAFRRYDLSRDTKVTTFMSKRVIGSILDFARGNDHVPRQIRTAEGEIKRLIDKAKKGGETLKLEQIYEELPEYNQDTVKKAYALAIGNAQRVSLQTVKRDDGARKVSLQDITEDDHPSVIIDHAERMGNLELIEKLLGCLSLSERQIVVGYFLEERNMEEVGSALDLSESRVSQSLTKIIRRLRAKAHEYVSEE